MSEKKVEMSKTMKEKLAPKQFTKTPINGTKYTILVSSAKGGVGKSTVAINIAFALQNLGLKIGILDADVYGGVTNAQIFNYIKDNLEFDQLIWEFGTEDNPAWVHVSLSKRNNRNQILRAYKVDGKTKYEIYG